MNVTEKLDLAIKLKESGTTEGFYAVPYKGGVLEKPTYMSNKEWEVFLAGMPSKARKEYGEGDGGELKEKDGRPPKMASYGSSSRMIYNLSHQNENFKFEKKLPTTVGGTANLDGFCEKDGRYIFVEAKCHEPYSMKANVVSTCYTRLYEFINQKMGDDIRIEMTDTPHTRYMNVEYFAADEKLTRFDLKQMICHLLGIATGILNGTLEKKPIEFIYLLYDPTELDIEHDAKGTINRIYERTCYECNLIDFNELFEVIFEFLKSKKSATAIDVEAGGVTPPKFKFELVSQEFYPRLI